MASNFGVNALHGAHQLQESQKRDLNVTGMFIKDHPGYLKYCQALSVIALWP